MSDLTPKFDAQVRRAGRKPPAAMRATMIFLPDYRPAILAR
jgi:hypothetical protein